jgi:hypothetical protein
MVACWGVAIVLVISAWAFFTHKSPTPASADEPAPTAVAVAPTPTPVAPAPVVITPVASKPTISITSTSLHTNSGAMDEYQYMARLNQLQGEHLAKFDRACAEREIAINYWTKGPGKQVEDVRNAMKAAKTAKDESAVAELQTKFDLLNQMDIDYRTMLRANVMAELTLEQQRRWAGFVINGQIIRKLTKLELSDRQKERIQAIADQSADKLIQQGTLEKDPFLNNIKTPAVIDPLVKQARDKVLTIEQRMRVPEPGKTGPTVIYRGYGAQ